MYVVILIYLLMVTSETLKSKTVCLNRGWFGSLPVEKGGRVWVCVGVCLMTVGSISIF